MRGDKSATIDATCYNITTHLLIIFPIGHDDVGIQIFLGVEASSYDKLLIILLVILLADIKESSMLKPLVDKAWT